ncbi:MAG: hypothetical protein JWP78_1050, partial [Mucilaginibacter sp.]|nr:hypothetical protein [Mucilaginibacter sp.]
MSKTQDIFISHAMEDTGLADALC